MWIESYKPKTENEKNVLELYHSLLDAWNEQDARRFAYFFSGTALIIGFDGSLMHGYSETEVELKKIFADHHTGKYLFKIRDIKKIDENCFLLMAVAGLIPAKSVWVDPSKNAIQTMLAVKTGDEWHIELFQNTPAQYHGRPQVSEELTEELNEIL